MLATVYLIFNAGYGPPVRAGLCAEAIRLARVLVALMPDEGEAIGLLALMLLQDSRREARVDAAGQLVLLPDQDRSRWDAEAIAEGERLVARGWRLGRLGPHACRPRSPSSTRAARTGRGSSGSTTSCYAISPTADRGAESCRGARRARRPGGRPGAIDGLDLAGYHLFHAARADLLRRLDRREEAAEAY